MIVGMLKKILFDFQLLQTQQMIYETVINYGIVSSTLINKDIRKVNLEPTNFRYRKIPNVSPPECKPPLITNTIFPPNIIPPENKVNGEFQVQLLDLSKTGMCQ